MIEWVDIKDWESDGSEAYLALLNVDNPLNKVVVLSATYTHIPGAKLEWCGRRVTHAAKINFPVEKTLEEKFEGYLRSQAVYIPESELLQLLQIAEQHYEGEK